jgi:predicted glycoside hydrolase/deacetylase ChbG (UPF0249 family)
MSAEINQAVAIAFRNDWITTASLMTNMPGFEDACSLIESEKLQARVGVHLNLSEGVPITHRIRACERFCDESGMFRNRAAARESAFFLSEFERQAVRQELEAQIRALSSLGIHPCHLDSHRHHHTEWAIGQVVIELARQADITAIRIMRNCKPLGGPVKRVYRAIFNRNLRRAALARSRYFGSAAEIKPILKSCAQVEIMVHPRLVRGEVFDLEKNLLSSVIADLQAG